LDDEDVVSDGDDEVVLGDWNPQASGVVHDGRGAFGLGDAAQEASDDPGATVGQGDENGASEGTCVDSALGGQPGVSGRVDRGDDGPIVFVDWHGVLAVGLTAPRYGPAG
jgi:hypothetical protein